jgi:hypothetical protein
VAGKHARCAELRRAKLRARFRLIHQTSYWVSGAKEMAAIKTILIIVNSIVP